jgi:hypothetical protein
MRAWFYRGDNFGQEFAYPKTISLQIAKVANAPVPTIIDEKVVEVAELKTAPIVICDGTAVHRQHAGGWSTGDPLPRLHGLYGCRRRFRFVDVPEGAHKIELAPGANRNRHVHPNHQRRNTRPLSGTDR